MFENILIGIDGRDGGRDAIAFAQRLASPAASITLAHVHAGALNPMHAVAPAVVREEQQASSDLLARERAAAEIDAELVSVVALSPGGGLHAEADARGADLIAVGSCSRGLLGRAMLGDDTRDALNGAPCAVAIAARGYAESPRPLAKVGVAYNDSPESRHALAVARQLAEPTRASIHALEVVEIPSVAYTGIIPIALGESIDALMDGARKRLAALDDVDGRVAYGIAGEELAAFAAEVDLLVVGSRGYGPLRRLITGSTSRYLERHTRSSLLILPRADVPAVQDDPGREASAQRLQTPV